MELIDIQTAAKITQLSEVQILRWIQENKVATHLTDINQKPQTLIFKHSLIQCYQKDLLAKLLLCEALLSEEDALAAKKTFLSQNHIKSKNTSKKIHKYKEDSGGIIGFLMFIVFCFILFQVWANLWI